VGWEEGASVLVATCGVADLAGKVERETLRNSTKNIYQRCHNWRRKRDSATYFCKLGGFSAAVSLALQAGTPHG
jgi:hypothetical protein